MLFNWIFIDNLENLDFKCLLIFLLNNIMFVFINIMVFIFFIESIFI